MVCIIPEINDNIDPEDMVDQVPPAGTEQHLIYHALRTNRAVHVALTLVLGSRHVFNLILFLARLLLKGLVGHVTNASLGKLPKLKLHSRSIYNTIVLEICF